MYSDILFPVDLEHEASWKKALPVVRSLAGTFGAGVHVLTVVAEVRGTMASEFLPPEFETQLVDNARARITDFIATHLGGLKSVDGYVATGRPYKEIVAAADRLECDLIVMGSHRPAALDILIGPNADNVVRHAKQSVMVVRD